jgi:DNA-binding response OmpR family regulator
MVEKKRILVVDDEEKLVDAIAAYLEKEGYEVLRAGTARDGISLFRSSGPSLVILDLMLPDLPGEAVCETIRMMSRVPIIMLTAKTEEKDLLCGFESGTDDYIVKPFSPRELVARVRALIKRTQSEPVPLVPLLSFNAGELVIDSEKYELRKSGEDIKLTNHEWKILLALASFPQRVFSREDLVKSAFGNAFDGFDRTIDAHIKNIRKKIEPDPRDPKYIVTVYGTGYKFQG